MQFLSASVAHTHHHIAARKQFRNENPHHRKMRLCLVVVVVFLFLVSIKIQLNSAWSARMIIHILVFEVPGRCFKTKNNDSVSLCVSYNLKFCFLPLSLWERKKRCRRFLSKNVSKPWIRGEAEIWLCARQIASFASRQPLDAAASNYIKLHLPPPIMIDPRQTRCYYVGTDRRSHKPPKKSTPRISTNAEKKYPLCAPYTRAHALK